MSEPAPDHTSVSSSTDSTQDARGRREARLHTPELECSMGRVADMTGSGMRLIFAKGKPPQVGEIQSYTFSDSSGSLCVTGCVKWVRKGSTFSRRCEIGVEFVKLDQGVRDALVRLAVQGKIHDPGAGYVRIETTDLYRVLGLTRYASEEQIDEAFNAGCNTWSEKNADKPQAAQKLDELYKAYAVLSDPDKRARYDTRYADQHDRAA